MDLVPRESPDWLLPVARGEIAAVPSTLDWDHAVDFAHPINGYELRRYWAFLTVETSPMSN